MGRAELKHTPEDFQVIEEMGVDFTGEGEFLWIECMRRGMNTADVSKLLATHCQVSPRAVSQSGLKDRQAEATQWFCVHLPGKPDPDLRGLPALGVQVLRSQRHQKKLRTGTHQGNRFVIRLRDLSGSEEALAARCETLARQGVPNYFGPQRFGRRSDNVRQAAQLYASRRRRGRHLTGLLHSAARSFIFNQALAVRVRDGSWRSGGEDEIWMLAGTRSTFGPEPFTQDLEQRCHAGDISPTGPLPGKNIPDSWPRRERELLEGYPALCQGLAAAGLTPSRRRLVLRPGAFSWRLAAGDLWLEFGLGRGEFATAVIRELLTTDASETGTARPADQ
ncbi:MAG: tRNA pseudouridine(13) synthase TruD [Pseudomonadota bacterium]